MFHSRVWVRWFRRFSSDRLTFIWHEQLVHMSELYLATNGRIDIPTAGSVVELVSAHPRPRPRGSSGSNARLTTSLMDNPLAAANVRTRRIRLCGSLTVNASLASLTATGCFSR